jgi:hypothetical protein
MKTIQGSIIKNLLISIIISIISGDILAANEYVITNPNQNVASVGDSNQWIKNILPSKEDDVITTGGILDIDQDIKINVLNIYGSNAKLRINNNAYISSIINNTNQEWQNKVTNLAGESINPWANLSDAKIEIEFTKDNQLLEIGNLADNEYDVISQVIFNRKGALKLTGNGEFAADLTSNLGLGTLISDGNIIFSGKIGENKAQDDSFVYILPENHSNKHLANLRIKSNIQLNTQSNGITRFKNNVMVGKIDIEGGNNEVVFEKPVGLDKLIIQDNSVVTFNEPIKLFNKSGNDLFSLMSKFNGQINLGNAILYLNPSDFDSLANKISLTSNGGSLGISDNWNYDANKLQNLIGKAVDDLRIANDKTLVVPNNTTLAHNIFTKNDGTGRVVFEGFDRLDGSSRIISNRLGSEDASLRSVDLNGNNLKINFSKEIFSNAIQFNGTGQSLYLRGNKGFNGNIKTSKDSQGTVVLENSGSLKDIGSAQNQIQLLQFVKTNDQTPDRILRGDIYSQKVLFDNGNFVAQNDLLIKSNNINFDGSQLNVGDKVLRIDGNNGDVNISNSMVVNLEYTPTKHGKLIMQNVKSIQGVKDVQIVFNIDDKDVTPNRDEAILDLHNIVMKRADIVVSNPRWRYDIETQSIVPVDNNSSFSVISNPENQIKDQVNESFDKIDSISEIEVRKLSSESMFSTILHNIDENVGQQNAENNQSNTTPVIQEQVPESVQDDSVQQPVNVNLDTTAPLVENSVVTQNLSLVEDNNTYINNDHSSEPSVQNNYSEPSVQANAKDLDDAKEFSSANQPQNNFANQPQNNFANQIASSNVASSHTEQLQGEKLQEVQQPSVAQSDNITKHASDHGSIQAKSVSQMMLKRTHNFIDNTDSSEESFAPAAGDDSDKMDGFWVNGFGGYQVNKSSASHKDHYAGGSIGFERFFDNQTAIGASFTNIDTDIKYSSSDKISGKNYILSLYGINKINNFILNNSVFIGQGRVKTQRHVTSNDIANGKLGSNIYGIHSILAYNMQKDSHFITPSASLQYSYLSQDGYTETGSSSENQVIGKKNAQILTSSLGVKYGYMVSTDNLKVVPGLQVSVANDLLNKSSDIQTKIQWQDEYAKLKANNKRQTTVSLTPSIVIQGDMINTNISYTYDKSQKITGHSVSLKLLVLH